MKDLHTFYGQSHVLQGVSLRASEGQVAAILGRNGAGKTTLIRSVMGAVRPRAGQVLFRERDIAGLSTHQINRLGIALVPQGRRVFPSLTVRENLSIAVRQPREGLRPWDLNRVYELFPILRERQANRANKLSGGEQQMLATARALVSNPHFLLMDEPSEGLAPLLVRELGRVIEELKAAGLSVLLVEQKVPFALRHADVAYVLSKGRIVYMGTPAELAGNEDVKSRYLGMGSYEEGDAV